VHGPSATAEFFVLLLGWRWLQHPSDQALWLVAKPSWIINVRRSRFGVYDVRVQIIDRLGNYRTWNSSMIYRLNWLS